MDETYIKVKGKWAYLYRAVGSRGDTIDFHLSQTRNANAAKRFLGKALRGCRECQKPCVINTDKAGCNSQAIRDLKKEGKCPSETDHRQVKYLNDVVEADHGKLKRLIKPTLGFESMKTAYTTIKGFEAMRALRKKQASAFQLQPGIRGEVRLVERAFGIGPEMMSELMSLHGAELEQIAIQQGLLRKGGTRSHTRQLRRIFATERCCPRPCREAADRAARPHPARELAACSHRGCARCRTKIGSMHER